MKTKGKCKKMDTNPNYVMEEINKMFNFSASIRKWQLNIGKDVLCACMCMYITVFNLLLPFKDMVLAGSVFSPVITWSINISSSSRMVIKITIVRNIIVEIIPVNM
jgi:hypothetical protein